MQITREELYNRIKKKELASVTLVYGSEEFFLEELVAVLRNKFKDASGWGFEILDAQSMDSSALAASASTLAFDMGIKVSVVRSATRLKKEQLEFFKRMAGRDAKERAVILIAEKEGKQLDALLKWAKEAKIIVCELQSLNQAEVASWLRSESSKLGFSIDPKTLDFMIDVSASNLIALSQMLAKIDLYRGDKTSVNFKDVEDLLSDSFEKGVYDCVRAVFAIGQGRISPSLREKAIREFARVLRFGASDGVVELVYALSREAFTLLKYQLLKDKGVSKDALAKELRLGSRAWLLNKEYPERAIKWPKERLEKFLHRLADVDLAIRTTGRDAEAMLEQIVIGNLAPTSVEETHEIFV